MSKFIKDFKQISKKDVEIAGGKGASLGEMARLRLSYGGQADFKMPVPPGFIILAKNFDYFLTSSTFKVKKGQKEAEENLDVAIQAELDKVNYDDINSVDKASNVIRDLINDAAIPEDLAKDITKEFKKLFRPHPAPPLRKGRKKSSSPLPRGRLGGGLVAVRSSATAEDSEVASWAGELETYLNTTEKTLLNNVKNCWSSLFTPRAIFYRREKELLETHVSVAVVVQEMVESEISGITFTVHPVTQEKNQMIIEAGFGLGEAIVSGSITPDSYVIDKKDWSMIDINVAKQKKQIVRDLKKGVKWTPVQKSKQDSQKLTGDKIIKLGKICAQIEKHYKKPQDIEWALKDGKFYILQSRPITTL